MNAVYDESILGEKVPRDMYLRYSDLNPTYLSEEETSGGVHRMGR